MSEELFHFVGWKHPGDDEANYQTLAKIITSRCVTYDPAVTTWGATRLTVDWSKSLLNGEFVVPQMTCFCDVPYDGLAIHLSKYGRFGLSLNRHHLIRYGARPVIYVPKRTDDWGSPNGAALLRDLEATFRGYEEQLAKPMKLAGTNGRPLGSEPSTPEQAVNALGTLLTKDFLAFVKPYDSELPESHRNYFYAEREWRKIGAMKFSGENVGTIVVADAYVDRCRKDPAFAAYLDRIRPAPAVYV